MLDVGCNRKLKINQNSFAFELNKLNPGLRSPVNNHYKFCIWLDPTRKMIFKRLHYYFIDFAITALH